jgi:hypothetical protein
MFKKITNAELKSELLEIQDKLNKLTNTNELKSELSEIQDKLNKLTSTNELKLELSEIQDKLNNTNELKLELSEIQNKIDKLSLNTNIESNTSDTSDISELVSKLLKIEENMEKLNHSLNLSIDVLLEEMSKFIDCKYENKIVEIDYDYIINELSKKLNEMYKCNLENTNKHIDKLFDNHIMSIKNTINIGNEILIDDMKDNKMFIDLINKDNKNNNMMLKNIDEKIVSIYFENELIKHQLVLEDEIRSTIQEVKNLGDIITSAISQIDSVIKK